MLVRTSASIWAALMASRSAAMRAGRRSAMGGNRKTLHQPAQSELIAVRPESANHCDSDVGQRRASTLRLAGVDVGEMNLHERNLHSGQRVADRETGMAI